MRGCTIWYFVKRGVSLGTTGSRFLFICEGSIFLNSWSCWAHGKHVSSFFSLYFNCSSRQVLSREHDNKLRSHEKVFSAGVHRTLSNGDEAVDTLALHDTKSQWLVVSETFSGTASQSSLPAHIARQSIPSDDPRAAIVAPAYPHPHVRGIRPNDLRR